MTQETDYSEFDGEEATPSQAALDQRLQGQAALQRAEAMGRIALARHHVLEAQQEGGDPAAARAILGRLDLLAENPAYEDAEEVYGEYRAYIRGRAQPQASAPSGAAPPAKASQPARPAGASPLPAPGSAKERAALLDPNTPIPILQQIRARQKGG